MNDSEKIQRGDTVRHREDGAEGTVIGINGDNLLVRVEGAMIDMAISDVELVQKGK